MADKPAPLDFPPEVVKFVNQTLQNTSRMQILRPNMEEARNPTAYNQSQFYQLRMACIRGEVQKAIDPEAIDQPAPSRDNPTAIPVNFGKTCDLVRKIGADAMLAGKDVTDPTHILAPYYVGAKARKLDEGRTPVDAAMFLAKATSDAAHEASKVGKDGALGTVPITFIDPKSSKQFVVNSTLGASADATFTQGIAVNIHTGKIDGMIAGSSVFDTTYPKESSSCSATLDTGKTTRTDCHQVGARLYDVYKKSIAR